MKKFTQCLLNLIILFILCKFSSAKSDKLVKEFPADFLFGVSTSAYQIEGGWNSDEKGENTWDHFTHKNPNSPNGDIACDSYHKLHEDIALLKDLGVNFYKFSISWTRIFPNGFPYKTNAKGVDYYNQLITLLIKNGIQPMVTLFDWDTPQVLEELGGFSSSLIVEWFEDYARILFENFGDRVKLWITFNDPKKMCLLGYGGGKMPPGSNSSGIGEYMCTHNVLKSHAKVYRLYDKIYRHIQKGKISIAIEGEWYEPLTNSTEDIDATERAMAFGFAWYTDPIYHPDGDYPQIMKISINKRSYLERFFQSRLPVFDQQEIEHIKGSYDFFALNHFTTKAVADRLDDPVGSPSYYKDLGVEFSDGPEWANGDSTFIKDVPQGFRKLLRWIKSRYGNVEIFVTSNGFMDDGKLEDQSRINYHKLYLNSALESISIDKINLKGYAVWSLMDGFNWETGFRKQSGLYHVNFSDPDRHRTPKLSAGFYKSLIKEGKLILSSVGDKQKIDIELFSLCFLILLSIWC